MDEAIDNKENANIKKRIYQVDNLIDKEKKKLHDFDDLHETAVALNKSLNKCFELLLKSTKNSTKERILDDIFNKNQLFYSNYANAIDDEIEITKNNINYLLEEKDKIKKENNEKKE